MYVLDVNQKENKLIFSERSKESVVSDIDLVSAFAVGDVIQDAEITGIVDFGLFVK